jgi:hypothetical protein
MMNDANRQAGEPMQVRDVAVLVADIIKKPVEVAADKTYSISS